MSMCHAEFFPYMPECARTVSNGLTISLSVNRGKLERKLNKRLLFSPTHQDKYLPASFNCDI